MKIREMFIGKTGNSLIQFFRYVIVGGGATVVQYALLLICKEGAGMGANLSNAVGFFGGLLTNYFISTFWVFDESKVKNKAAEFTAFALIGVVGLGINQGLIWVFDNPVAGTKIFGNLLPTDKYYLVGQVLATAIAFLWNFFARKYLLYHKGNTSRKENMEG